MGRPPWRRAEECWTPEPGGGTPLAEAQRAGTVTAQPRVAAIGRRPGRLSVVQTGGRHYGHAPDAGCACFLGPQAPRLRVGGSARSAVASTHWLLEAIKEVEQTGEEAQRAIGEGVASIDKARERLVAGVPVSDIVDDLIARGGRQARLRSSAAIDAFEHAVMVYRVGLIRAMVDEEKLSFSEVGRRMGVSRQMIARLYRYDERADTTT